MLACALQAFDELLLMKLGGRIVYHGALGKHSSMLVEYLEVRKHLLQCYLLLKLQHSLRVHVELHSIAEHQPMSECV